MPNRPYSQKGAAELESIVDAAWGSLDVLQQVALELTYRKTSKARRLDAKVQRRLAELRNQDRQRSGRPEEQVSEDALFAEVGLHPSAPDFLIQAAQKAFRKYYHPDAYSDKPESDRRSAEEVFKRIETIFSRIFAKRAGA